MLIHALVLQTYKVIIHQPNLSLLSERNSKQIYKKILPEATHASQAKHEEPRELFYETKLKSSNHETIRDHFQLFLLFIKRLWQLSKI
jgi:hypothetical protein